MTEGLQGELTQKEELYIHLKNDYHRLEQNYNEALNLAETADNSKEK